MKKAELKKIIRESIKELISEKQLLTELYTCSCTQGTGMCTVVCVEPADDHRSVGCDPYSFMDTGSGCASMNLSSWCRGGCLANIQNPDAGGDDFRGGRNIHPKFDNDNMIQKNMREETNQCKQEGFCCKKMFSPKQTDATIENGVCSCPKGSKRINC
jgi:hypothetical protein